MINYNIHILNYIYISFNYLVIRSTNEDDNSVYNVSYRDNSGDGDNGNRCYVGISGEDEDSGDNGTCRDNVGRDDRDSGNDYCRNSGYICGDDGREGDVGNDDSSVSNDDGDGGDDGDGDGIKAKCYMIRDVPDIRIF